MFISCTIILAPCHFLNFQNPSKTDGETRSQLWCWHWLNIYLCLEFGCDHGGAAVENVWKRHLVLTVECFTACRKHLMILSLARILLKHGIVHRYLLKMLWLWWVTFVNLQKFYLNLVFYIHNIADLQGKGTSREKPWECGCFSWCDKPAD